MINHLRTLLMNTSGSTKPDLTYPGEEYIPPVFTAQSLPVELSIARNLLFGPSSDRAMFNYRLRQYLTLLHTTELADYVYALDPRVTYWPLYDTTLFESSSFGAGASLTGGSGNWLITILGDAKTLTSTGRLFNSWQVQVLTNQQVTVTHHQDQALGVTSNYTVTSGISNPIALPGTPLSFVFTPGTGALPTWEIQSLARPLLDLPDIYAIISQTVDIGILNLFGSASEPYKSCNELWNMPSGPIAYKLGAVVLCLGYKLNELYMNI